MGKVGSSTVLQALRLAGMIQIAGPGPLPIYRDAVMHTHEHGRAREILAHMRAHETGRQIIVLTLTRELLGRAVSGFFQNMSNPRNSQYLGEPKFVQRLSPEQLVAAFRARQDWYLDRLLLPWFDEFSRTIDFDIYSSSFPHDSGGGMALDAGGRTVAVVRLEDLGRAENFLADLCELPHLDLTPRNVAEQKPIAAQYRAFCSAFEPTRAELDRYYGSRMMRHFYSSDEIVQFARKWGTVSERVGQGGMP
jgi:hypothetical protein